MIDSLDHLLQVQCSARALNMAAAGLLQAVSRKLNMWHGTFLNGTCLMTQLMDFGTHIPSCCESTGLAFIDLGMYQYYTDDLIDNTL